MSRVASIGMFLALALFPIAAAADSAAPALQVIPEPPSPVKSVCADLQPSFVAIRATIDSASHAASDAGMNAKGLGFWSANRHFRTVEDDYIAVTKLLAPALDATSSVPIWLDPVADGPDKKAASELGDGYEASLRSIKRYVTAALVFERAAYGRRAQQSAALGGGLYGAVASANANNREMSADEARTILDSQEDLIADSSRILKLPEFHWSKACSVASGAFPVPSPSP